MRPTKSVRHISEEGQCDATVLAAAVFANSARGVDGYRQSYSVQALYPVHVWGLRSGRTQITTSKALTLCSHMRTVHNMVKVMF